MHKLRDASRTTPGASRLHSPSNNAGRIVVIAAERDRRVKGAAIRCAARKDCNDAGSDSGTPEDFRGQAIRIVGNDVLTELLRLDNRVCMDCWIILPHSLVGEEKKQPIMDDRAADAPSKLAEKVVYAAKAGVVLVGMPKRTAIFVEGVQARTVELEKSASVISVGAALGSHFYLRTRIAAVLGGISA